MMQSTLKCFDLNKDGKRDLAALREITYIKINRDPYWLNLSGQTAYRDTALNKLWFNLQIVFSYVNDSNLTS